jgi:hypothetical protein
LYPECESHDIYYLKPNKYETLSDANNDFLESITKITDYQPGDTLDDTHTTWFGETTFCYQRPMYFKAVYEVQYGIDTIDCWITVSICGDPEKVGGLSRFT